jgi:hypothetical protein
MAIDLETEWLAQLEAELTRRLRQKEAVERHEASASEEFISRLEQMAGRLIRLAHPGDVELADELTQAANWAAVDIIRMKHDLSPAVALAYIYPRDPERAIELLGQFSRRQHT